MKKNNKPTPSERVLGSPAVRQQMTASVRSLTQTLASSMGQTDPKKTPIGVLAEKAETWTRCGLEAIADAHGLKRHDFLTNFETSLEILVTSVRDKKGRKLIAQAVKSHLELALDGDIGYPIDMTYVKSHQVLRDIVREDKGKGAVYRQFHCLPGLFPIKCSCCYTAKQFGLMQNIGSVKGKELLTRTGIHDMVSQLVDKRHSAISKHVTGIVEVSSKMDPADAMLMGNILEGETDPSLGMMIVTTRRSQRGHISYDAKVACAMCVHTMDNPKIAAGMSHAIKWLTDARYALASMQPGKLRHELQLIVNTLKSDKAKADAHQEEVQRLATSSGIEGEGIVQMSHNFSKVDDKDLALRLIEAGFIDDVVFGRKKTDTPRLKRPINRKALLAKLDLLNEGIMVEDDLFDDLEGEEE
jgi:hypothetical protein